MADIDEEAARRQQEYEAQRALAERVTAASRVEAMRTAPPSTTSQFVGAQGQLIGPVQTDEYGVTRPAPPGSVGIRGYPAPAAVSPEMVSPEGGVYADIGQAMQARAREEKLASAGVVRTPGGAFLDTSTGTFVTNPEQAAATTRIRAAIGQYGLMAPAGGGPAMIATPENIDRFNPAVNEFAEQRAGVRNQMQDTMNRLQSLSGRKDAYGRDERARLTGAYRDLQRQHDDTLRQEHNATMEGFHRAAENAKLQKDINLRGSMDSLNNAMYGGGIDQYPAGSPERREALRQIALDPANKAALNTRHGATEFGKLWNEQSQHENVNRTLAEQTAAGLTAVPTGIGARGGVSYRFKTQDEMAREGVPEGVRTKVATLQGDLAFHAAQSAAERAANIAANKPDTPYSKSSQLTAAQTELGALQQTYPNLLQPVQRGAIQPAAVQPAVAPSPPAAPAVPAPYGVGGGGVPAATPPQQIAAATAAQPPRVRRYNPQTGQLE